MKLECKECSKIREYLKNSPLTDFLMSHLKNIIEEDLNRKGFIKPEVSFNFSNGNLRINVNEGERIKVKDIKFLSLNNEKIKELEELKGNYYDKDKILKKIKKIEKKYQKDFPLIKISLNNVKFEENGALLEIEIKDDEKLKFRFGENINRREKNKILKRIKSENADIDAIPVVLDDYSNELIRNGYKAAKIFYDKNKEGEIEKISIDLYKGEKYVISDIKFNEGLTINPVEVLSHSNLKIGKIASADKINEFIENIKYFYWERGFWDVNIKFKEELVEKGKVILNININEGQSILCEKIEILNFPSDSKAPELNLKEDEPLKRSNVEKDLQNLQKCLNDAGYYYAKVLFKVEERKVYYIIDAGEKFKINKILFKGLNNVSLKEIKNEIKIKEKEPFSFENLIELQANLFATSLFSSVNINPSHKFDEENSINLKTELKEAPPMTYSYGIGYDSDDRFRLQFNFSHINFLNKRYILNFEGRLFSDQQMWRLSLKDPTFLYSKYPLFFGTYRSIEKRPSFSLKRWGSLVEITRNLGKMSQATLRYEYQILLPFKVEENYPIPKEEQEKKVSSISFIYLNDKRDDIFFPREGSFFSGEVKYSFPLLFADTNFLKTVVQFSYNKSPLKSMTFAFSSRVGYIKNFKKEPIPIGERLFLGGRNTLRAYSRDYVGIEDDTVINGIPLGGDMSFLLNLEGRQFLSRSFGLNVFTDFGQVFSSYKLFKFKDLAGGYGMGIFFLTPVGPLRIEVSKKYKGVFWDDDYQWYFSLGFPF